jgi:ribosomal protein L20
MPLKNSNEQFNRNILWGERYAFSDIPQLKHVPGLLKKADEFFKKINSGMYITTEHFFKAAKTDMTSVMKIWWSFIKKKERKRRFLKNSYIVHMNFENTLDTFSYGTSEEKLLLEKKKNW